MLRLVWLAAKRLFHGLKALPREAVLALGGAVGDQPVRPKRFWLALGITVPLATLTWQAIPSVTIVMSPSIDAWAVRAAPGAIHKGDLVMFALSHPIAGPRPVSVTKRAMCMPGERLREVERHSVFDGRVTNSSYYCGDLLLGISRPVGRDGQRLDHLHWGDHAIPAGFVYVGSDHREGFDSRYFGPVRIERLTRMERVL
ncbi:MULTISPECIES: S26 family signal peptidase [Sphingobium]|jgi:type IV secretory pathway protease TraF|uniref:Conjugal transfer protein TraF n=1 Tax=Sphingobium yanoikuyae TaxID=13690 RepID=A0A084EJ26_SPHYA|nr:S26 family signal peptidase [Sphingobium yanoikuyae]KEZ17968.1 Conjugal transfer protein TraF [Sphingobium yanoikuyae]NBB41563.1 peptidase [Sphingobium yanoikuyae]